MKKSPLSNISTSSIKGLYAITPDMDDTQLLLKKVEAALQGGISILQYRNKQANHKLQTQQARSLLPLCRQFNVPLIINDSVKLCLTLDADGVHLGADDGNLAEVRDRIGVDKILGASCYNRFDLALTAQKEGADYVAFGACFASNTKPNAPMADLVLFKRASTELNIPNVAIGGINLQNAPQVIQSGADAIAVIQAIFTADDVKFTTQQFSQLFNL
ncbi:MAG: thiamine phosphate synthase [Pseudomonadota bacterium]